MRGRKNERQAKKHDVHKDDFFMSVHGPFPATAVNTLHLDTDGFRSWSLSLSLSLYVYIEKKTDEGNGGSILSFVKDYRMESFVYFR
jgi:hypothetical protein